MLKILVPTDFSETAENAMIYAINLAKKLEAEIIFFHSSHLPVIVPGTPFNTYDGLVEDEMAYSKKNLETLTDKIAEKAGFKNKMFSVVMETGFASDEIPKYAKKANCNLIVMGTTGASGLNYIIGSNAHAVMKHSEMPVIAVPKGFDSNLVPEKIILATDYKKTANQLTLLNKITEKFDSEIFVLHIQPDEHEVHSYEEKQEELSILEAVKPFKHSFHSQVSDDIAASIKDFAREKKAGLIVMVAHESDFMERLFGLSMTKEITHSSEMPVMVIRD
ncbi:MAG: universal stress protein [Bacteroidetes bacterium]|nr:universal stress protein [Bacteroidota bacterium]